MSADRPGSRHDRYRERLAALATDPAPLEAIFEAGRRSGSWSADRHWVRTYGRFSPDKEPFVTMVFETALEPQLLCRVEAFTIRPAAAEAAAFVVELAGGWLSVTPFPCDEALPTLPAALAHPGHRTIVRYRPRSRCTIRFDAPESGVRFAKVYNDDSGELCHVHGQLLWDAARRSELEFAVARPDRWDGETRTLWQEGIAGVPLTARHLDAAGDSLAGRMGRAAASLTRSTIQPRVVYDWAAHTQRAILYASDLCHRVSRFTGVVDALLRELREVHARLESRPKRPIHGSLSRTQWVDGGSQLGLIDFDKLAFGDPEFDAAALLAELDYDHLQMDRIRGAFLSSYETVAGPLDRRLFLLYSAQERLEKALKSARAVRPDGDLRAELHLETAHAECVEASA